MIAIPAFWLFLVAMLAFEFLLPIHHRPRETSGRLLANFGLGIVNAALFSLLPLSTVLAARWAADAGIGVMNAVTIPWAAAFAVTVLLRSLAAYLLHVLVHRLPWLWRIHRVHHADTAIDLSTGFRHHPLELFLVAAAHALLAIALGLSVPALIAYESLAVLFSLWTHVNFRLPPWFERVARLILVTPPMHHAHHSAHRPVTDSNYGELFSFWDRLFGTYTRLDYEQLCVMPIGLGEAYDPHSGKFLRQLSLPFVRMQHDIRPTPVGPGTPGGPLPSSEQR